MAAPKSHIVITADASGAIESLEQVDDAATDADRALEKVDGTTVDVDADLEDVDQLRKQLRDITAREYRADVKVDTADIDVAARRMRSLDGNTRSTADTLQRGIGPARGFADELGGAAGAGGIAASAMIDAGEAIEIFGAKAGISEKTLSKMSGALGVAGLAVAGAAVLWSQYQKGQKSAQEATEKTAEAIAKIDAGEASEGIRELVEANRLLFDSAKDLGITYEQVLHTLTGGSESLGSGTDQIRDSIAALNDGEYTQWADVYARKLDTAQNSLAGLNDESDELAGITGELSGELADNVSELEAVAREADAAGYYTDRYGADAAAAAREVDGLTAAQRRLLGTISARQAWLNLEQSFDRVAVAGQSALDGTADSARDYELAVLDLIQSVTDYGIQIEDIPEEALTEIVALIEQGKYGEAERALEQLAEPRAVELLPYVSQRALDIANAELGGGDQSARSSVSVTVNSGTVADARTIQSELDTYARVNGTRWHI